MMSKTKFMRQNILGHAIPMVFFIGIACPNDIIQHTNIGIIFSNGIQQRT